MQTAAMACAACGVKVEGTFGQTFFNALPAADQEFLERYLLAGFSIKALEEAGPECRQMDDLRATAGPSRDAVYAGDFAALGRAMIQNTEAQGRLHADLISADAWRVIEIAREHGALGWKVNGAGGEGGSVTLLCGSLSHVKRAMIRAIEAENRLFKNIPITLSRHGLRVWERHGE